MAAGLSVKAMVGIAVLAAGMALYTTSSTLSKGVGQSIETVRLVWSGRG